MKLRGWKIQSLFNTIIFYIYYYIFTIVITYFSSNKFNLLMKVIKIHDW